ncbi:MAG: homoserine kinase [Rickettsiales bacterium]
MAVYTKLSDIEVRNFISSYEVGELVSFKGIAEGVSNTNYFVSVDGNAGRTNYILTIFEENFPAEDLPFIMEFTEYLADNQVLCPRPIYNKKSEIITLIAEKPAILIEFMVGGGSTNITTHHIELVGNLVATLHVKSTGFNKTRKNALSLAGMKDIFFKFSNRADEIFNGLSVDIKKEISYLEKKLPQNLPAGIVHTDIFPDNVFFIDGNTENPELSAIIDFYFSCHDFYIYDLMIVINAWCFDNTHRILPSRLKLLLSSYNQVRKLTDDEEKAMPIMGRLAALRFLIMRCYDYLNPVDNALVNIKDPMDYMKRLYYWRGYDENILK